MSLDHAKRCFEKFNSDRSFATAIAGGASKEASRKIVEDAGFYFTKDEWEQVLPDGAQTSEHSFGSAGRAGCTFPNECKG